MLTTIVRLFFIFTLLCQSGLSVFAGEWKFGIMGDTHDAPPRDPRYAGVAVDFIKLANQDFIRHKVDFVVQCGDLADAQGGQDPKGYKVRYDVAQDLRRAGIPFYALRGNHDTGKMRDAQMKEYFIPGAKETRKPKGFVGKGLDYGFRHKNASLYFLDIDNSLNPGKLVDWSKWLAAYRSSPSRPAHCIVFTHRNLHVPLNFRESLFGPRNESAPDQQNIFYQNLNDAGVNLFVTAHLHVHVRGLATSPDGRNRLNALIAAPCGEKISPKYLPLLARKDTPVESFIGHEFGYYIVTVKDDSLTVDFYGMEPEPGDKAPGKPAFTLLDSWNLPAATAKPAAVK